MIRRRQREWEYPGSVSYVGQLFSVMLKDECIKKDPFREAT